ncbi:unnamed protein product [Diatraea saccharalis]|uniref:Uncharacterized protein n=1 Tax=Diatraea saccharalis TaxID=40085 RepID=A0A9N9R5G7_9NEOP|nr:unnamed protein product [Diatraea saccharalis]
MELFDLEDFYYNRVNISGWRLVDRASDKVKEALQVMEKFHPIGASILSGGHIKTEPALLYDAVQVLALALSSTENVRADNISCDKETVWSQGRMLLDNEKPYVMVKEGWNLQGNARFEGFCIDLLGRVAARAGFHYKLRLVPDNMYGARDPDTGHWNGIVRELMDRKADIAVASMTINYAREAVIDFTKPFMNLGIGILFKVPTSQPTRLFSFLNPLAIEIWLYVLAASTGTHVCGHETKLLTNQFSVCNSFWFITGTFLRQGSGLNPKATSTRIVGGIWWFFTLIILSSYTANLAAFLTVERTVLPIQSAADLAAQTAIQYGTLNGGSTMTFFRDSNIDIYQKMWQHMSTASPPALVSSYEEGVRRVLSGNYAFLMESTMLDHRVQRDCNLTQIGGLLDSKGYGIATWKGSPWRDKISLAILELQEKGVIQILYDKWWKNTGDVCNRDGKDSKANPLGVQNIGVTYGDERRLVHPHGAQGGLLQVLAGHTRTTRAQQIRARRAAGPGLRARLARALHAPLLRTVPTLQFRRFSEEDHILCLEGAEGASNQEACTDRSVA